MTFNSWMGCQRFPAFSYHLQPSKKLIEAPPYLAVPEFSPGRKLAVMKLLVDIFQVLGAMSAKEDVFFSDKENHGLLEIA